MLVSPSTHPSKLQLAYAFRTRFFRVRQRRYTDSTTILATNKYYFSNKVSVLFFIDCIAV